MSEHTKSPWSTEKRDGDEWWFGGGGGAEIIIKAGDSNVAVMGATLNKEDEADANAEFICLAVNTHDELVAALRETIAGMKGLAGQQAMPDDWWMPVVASAEAALAKTQPK